MLIANDGKDEKNLVLCCVVAGIEVDIDDDKILEDDGVLLDDDEILEEGTQQENRRTTANPTFDVVANLIDGEIMQNLIK